MRFVPIKTDEQLDMQSLHRVRERWIMRRTEVVNQIRGLLLERGITVRTGRCHLDAALPKILEDGTSSLSGALRFLLLELKRELEQLAVHIEQAEALIHRAAQQSEACQRLDAIPVSAHSRPPLSLLPLETAERFARVGSLPPGSDWFRASTQREASRRFSASASEAMVICENYSFKGHAPCCSLEISSARA